MSALWLWLDSVPLGPLACFVLAYGLLLAGGLWFFHRNRHRGERCTRCGGEWRVTARGNHVHVCFPSRRACR